MGTKIAGFLMSVVLIAIGLFTLDRSSSGSLKPQDVGAIVALLGVAAGLLGLFLCGMFVTLSLRLAKIEKTLSRPS